MIRLRNCKTGYFRTALTNAEGTVIETILHAERGERSQSVTVDLTYPDGMFVRRIIHGDVLVEETDPWKNN